MSNWLGFSLTPHLRIHEGFDGREEDQQEQDHGVVGFPPHMSGMPLRSDGSLCFAADPFRRPDGSEGIAHFACLISYCCSCSACV